MTLIDFTAMQGDILIKLDNKVNKVEVSNVVNQTEVLQNMLNELWSRTGGGSINTVQGNHYNNQVIGGSTNVQGNHYNNQVIGGNTNVQGNHYNNQVIGGSNPGMPNASQFSTSNFGAQLQSQVHGINANQLLNNNNQPQSLANLIPSDSVKQLSSHNNSLGNLNISQNIMSKQNNNSMKNLSELIGQINNSANLSVAKGINNLSNPNLSNPNLSNPNLLGQNHHNTISYDQNSNIQPDNLNNSDT